MGNFDDYLLGQSIAFMQKHSQYGMSPLQSIKTQMGDENMEQRKFKVGDKIRVKNFAESKNGKLGKITDYDDTEWRPYKVELEDRSVWMLYNHEMELVEEKKMTGFEVLLKHWGIEVGEKFNIKESDCNPYYFDKDGDLYDCDDDIRNEDWAWEIVTECANIEKIKVKEMTIADIEKELGYAIKVVKEKK